MINQMKIVKEDSLQAYIQNNYMKLLNKCKMNAENLKQKRKKM